MKWLRLQLADSGVSLLQRRKRPALHPSPGRPLSAAWRIFVFQQQKSARKIALQALFQADVQGPDFLAEILPQFIAGATEDIDVRELATSMVLGAWGYHETADQWITQFSPRWSISRMPTVDRNILRLAAWELTNRADVPPKVVLDEAINLAREFSTDESAAFINGVLDAALKDYLLRTGKTL